MIQQKRPILSVLAVLAAAFALSACSLLSGGEGGLPALGPAPTATFTPPPTATSIPSPTPTPTPMPIEVVHQGERDLRNGDWDAASVSFQQVLADPGASDDERATAQLGLAHATLRSGDFTAALTALDGFLTEHPSHPNVAEATFLRGDAKMGLSDWSGAVADYQAYLNMKPGIIDSYVYERIGDAYLAAGQQADALAAYDQAVAADRMLVSELILREKVAQINRSLGNTAGAVAQYQAILAAAQNPFYLATIEYYLGQTWFEAGEIDAAYTQFEHVFMTYPESYEALSALRALLEAEYDVDQYQRGIVNYNQGQYDIAVQALLSHLAGLDDVRNDTPYTHLIIARSYQQLGNTQAALTELQALITRFNPEDGDEWADAWLEIAGIHASLDDTESALSTLNSFLEDYGDLPQAADAQAMIANLHLADGDTDQAAAAYRQLAANYPNDTRAPAGLFDTALTAYQNGDATTAKALLTEVANMPANEEPVASLLWRGKILTASGSADEGTQVLNNAAGIDPTGYFSLRAADLLAGQEPFWQPASFSLPEDPDAGRAEAEQWIVDTFGLEAALPLATSLRGDIAADPRMVRGRELWDLGMTAEARQNFEAVRSEFTDDPLAMYQLAIYFREIGLYRSSIVSAARLHILADIEPLDGPAFLARLRYPTYFSDLILQNAQQYDLDPLFVFSLIEQESLFEGFAISTASAQGLMQIWPPTGEDIALALNWPGYQSSDLQRPYVNVAFGTWLLRDELNRFDGSKYATLAAYNAGSGNALNWLNESGGDPDLFIEAITLSEPRSYIERIYEHYAVYRALYGTP